MYFDFEDYRPDITPVGSALSWRMRAVGSFVAHVVAITSLLAGGRQTAAIVRVTPPPSGSNSQDHMRFVFVEPRVDARSPTPPLLRAPFSDEHRLAQTLERAPNPDNP